MLKFLTLSNSSACSTVSLRPFARALGSAPTNLKLLVVDGYDQWGVDRLNSVGATPAGDLTSHVLRAAAGGFGGGRG